MVDWRDCVTHTKHILSTNHTTRLLWDCRAYLYRAYRRHRHMSQSKVCCGVTYTQQMKHGWRLGLLSFCDVPWLLPGGRAAARAVQAGSRLLYHYGTRVLCAPAAMRHQPCCCRSHSWLCCLGRYLLKCGMREAMAGMWAWGVGAAAGCGVSFVVCDGACVVLWLYLIVAGTCQGGSREKWCGRLTQRADHLLWV